MNVEMTERREGRRGEDKRRKKKRREIPLLMNGPMKASFHGNILSRQSPFSWILPQAHPLSFIIFWILASFLAQSPKPGSQILLSGSPFPAPSNLLDSFQESLHRNVSSLYSFSGHAGCWLVQLGQDAGSAVTQRPNSCFGWLVMPSRKSQE